MRAGDAVLYAEAPGVLVEAQVTALVGTGESLHKVLDLTAKGRAVFAVPHVRDCRVTAGYWCQEHAEMRPVEVTLKRVSMKVSAKTIQLARELMGDKNE